MIADEVNIKLGVGINGKFYSLNKDILSERSRFCLDRSKQRNQTIGGYRCAS